MGEPSKEPSKSPPEPLPPTPSNNLLTAPPKTVDAMVVLWTTPSSTSRLPHSCSKETTHTRVLTDNASTSHPRVSVKLPTSSMLVLLTNKCNLLLPRDQLPLMGKPIKWPSKDTPVVSLPVDAEVPSITVSSLLVMEPNPDKTTSSSRTPGVPHGVLTDTSRSHQLNAVSSPLLPTQLSDLNDQTNLS